MQLKPVEWIRHSLVILDQTKLPEKEERMVCNNVNDVYDAIKLLKVRGAPLIGITAAYGILVGLLERRPVETSKMKESVKEIGEYIKSARPTAVNLEWAVNRMVKKSERLQDNLSFEEFFQQLEKEANAVFKEDYEMCEKIGENGSKLIKDGAKILTHCNAGILATGGIGTALSAIYKAEEQGKNITVYVDETRPLLQGARLTSYELMKAGIKAVLITDSMAAYVMKTGIIDMVITGADRIAANGDTANKIGTLNLGILCKYFKIPLYIAAPYSTFDFNASSGADIIVEQRDANEIAFFSGKKIIPDGIDVFNPAFDITDHTLITGFITDKGIISPPFKENLARIFSGKY